jgi:hypothetical protein
VCVGVKQHFRTPTKLQRRGVFLSASTRTESANGDSRTDQASLVPAWPHKATNGRRAPQRSAPALSSPEPHGATAAPGLSGPDVHPPRDRLLPEQRKLQHEPEQFNSFIVPKRSVLSAARERPDRHTLRTMETVAAASYAGRTGATRSPAYCAAMSFSQSYRPKVREALL